MNQEDTLNKGPIAWMAHNSVAANLLMFILIFGGLFMASGIKQEIFPEFELDIISITVVYPGASPEEIEDGIIVAIEDQVRALDGVKKVRSTAFEGRAEVRVEVLRGFDPGKILQDVNNAVDRIQTFPEMAEKPLVKLLDPRRQVISLVVSGPVDYSILRDLSDTIRDQLLKIEDITLVEFAFAPDKEIIIEIPQETLRSLNLTLPQIGKLIKQTTLDLPGGIIKTSSGEVLIRTKERREVAEEFLNIPIVALPDGTEVTLKDIAEIKETFEETDEEAKFDNMPATRIDIYRVGDQRPLNISEEVKAFAEEFQKTLPANIKLTPWNDRADIFADRIDLLTRNAILGLSLVLILLGLFLDPKLAFWVTLGIPVSIIGSFLFIPITGASINMIALFGFIITLGIIVDDAVLIGENIYTKRERGTNFLTAAILGAKEMALPVSFAVLTNMVAFLPLFFVPGTTGKFFYQIPAIVISVFFVSWIESLFILPAHLAIPHKHWAILDHLDYLSEHVEKGLSYFIDEIFMPALNAALKARYLTASIAISMTAILIGYVATGHMQFSYLPRVDSDIVSVQVVLPYGVPVDIAKKIEKKLIDSAWQIKDKKDKPLVRGVYAQIGKQIPGVGPAKSKLALVGAHNVGAQVFLVPTHERTVSGVEFANLWREAVGNIPEAEVVSFKGMVQTAEGPPLSVQLGHSDLDILEQSSAQVAQELGNYLGVFDIDDGVSQGKSQISIKLKPEAYTLKLSSQDVANQVRAAFYGEEAVRLQRGRDEIKVLVRLPDKERQQVITAEEYILRDSNGKEIPLQEAATLSYDTAYTHITRSDGQRIQEITADLNENEANANHILNSLNKGILKELKDKYPDLTVSFEGENREQTESLDALLAGYGFALFLIFAILAIATKSYFLPLVIMLSIPFGIIGALLGHMLLGYELSIVSMFGIAALSGVVINDSLVLVITIERYKEKLDLFNAVIDSSKRRFRPIMLTSLTTFFGLSPMIFERSMQARFLIPMAISLGFGILFATFIILFVTTAFYLIHSDLTKQR